MRIVLIASGCAALIWFLMRVVPKPSRASYPCQRAAFPLATSFVVWLSGSLASLRLAQRAREQCLQSRRVSGLLLGAAAVGIIGLSYFFLPAIVSRASAPVVSMVSADREILTELPSTVAVVETNHAQVAEIDQQEITRMVEEAVRLVGGLQQIIQDGDTVILKPNLVKAQDSSDNPVLLEPMVNGIATDYRIIQAVVDLVRGINPTGRIIVMESSAVGVTLDNMADLGWTSVVGVDDFIAIENASGDWYDYDSPLLTRISLHDDVAMFPDSDKPNNSREIFLNRMYYEAEVLISLPVLKNHSVAGITCSIKNLSMGALPCNIYGNGPAAGNPYHRGNFIDHSNDNVHRWIHDFFACRPADFTIVDGLQGLQFGPVAVGAHSIVDAQMKMGLVLAGEDALAVDAIAGLLMGHDPQLVNYLIYLNNHGFGRNNPGMINVVGERVENLRKDFFTQNYGSSSKFYKYKADPYALEFVYFDYLNNTLCLAVSDDSDLARMTFKLDGQALDQYVVGGFGNIELPMNEAPARNSTLAVLFEDRYLNSIEKSYSIIPKPRRGRGRVGN